MQDSFILSLDKVGYDRVLPSTPIARRSILNREDRTSERVYICIFSSSPFFTEIKLD